MREATNTVSGSNSGDPLAFNRILSIDIFRGFTMLLMIFVNDLSSVKGLPWWNYHAHTMENRMTYVDMVFPAFLFILGMALPLALERRLRKDASMANLIWHIVLRTVALIVLGLILANAEMGSPANMHGLSTNAWALLALTGGVLFWMVYPRGSKHAVLFQVLRWGGLGLIVAMAVLFRRVTRSGEVAWIQTEYAEILGLLGFTYFSVSILYLLTRRWAWAPLVWCVLLMGYCCATTARWITFAQEPSMWVMPLSNGAMAGIAMAGVFLSSLLFGPLSARIRSLDTRLWIALGFAIASLAAGWLLVPLGISKNRATPTWCLFSIGSSVLLFGLLYWVCDLKRHSRWAAFAKPAGSNTLMTYLLPDFFFYLVGLSGSTWLATHFSFGLPGLCRALIFTAFILGVSALLTRAKIRLQL